MRKRLSLPGRPVGGGLTTKLLTIAAITVLCLTAGLWAQETGSTGSAASVDQSFSALQQALSATANDLLAGAQRSTAATPPRPGLPEASQLSSRLDSPAAAGSEGNVHSREALDRVRALRPMIEPILREEGIPLQMAAVILVESGGRTTALSSKGARGLWQIMPETARRYGLLVSGRVDERLDPYKSSRAAARYLRDLYAQFGDWQLALAAYNAGEDAVERAIVRSSGRDFHSLARAGTLPLETRNYVPAVLSAIRMIEGAGSVTNEAGHPVAGIVYARDRLEN